ncbi:MAG TPA: succinate dehydrogenase flavoprotein subunit [Phycisphaerae bacterium]|nr:succinate dehydrogenase flavoprotein subunit [Phycisphaerae bacterium]
MAQKRVIVVGGGLAGLAAAMKLAEDNVAVDLFSLVPVKRSHSVCAQGGINACNEVARQQGYSEWEHFYETLKGGDFLANQPPVLDMARMAPNVIDLLDRMGVPFNRTSEGYRALRLFGGSLFKRTHYAGATTGQQLLYALDEQCRRWEVEGRITKYEFWDFLWPVLDDSGRCVGIVAQDLRTMQIRSFRADAVVMATGGNGLIFGQSTMSVICTGSASARCYAAGAWLGNPEFVQVHPTAIPGEDKCRLMSESARGEGGRIWVPKKKGDSRQPNSIPEEERDYFLERLYPKYKNIVPRDIATREIFYICEQGFGVGNGQMVYLDLTEKSTGIKYEELKKKLGGILEIYEKFVGVDPLLEPMRIYPAVHYSMGGLWVGFEKDSKPFEADGKGGVGGGMKHGSPKNQMTNVPGLYAAGEADYQYHGANRLGANSLLSCIFTGLFMGPSVKNYIESQKGAAAELPSGIFDARVRDEQGKLQKLLKANGDQNPYVLQRELGKTMSDNVTIIRVNSRMKKTLALIEDLKQRFQTKLGMPDGSTWSNQTVGFARAVWDMMLLSEAITKGAIAREESRGAHFKIPDDKAERIDIPLDARALPRDDHNWLKSTIASYKNGTCELSYEPVDIALAEPVKRDYGKTTGAAAAAAATKPVEEPVAAK